MNNYRLISNIGAACAILCIIFLPVVGCGDANLTGIDIIKDNQIGTSIKIFVIAAIICGVLIFFLKELLHIAICAIAGAVALFIAYMIAHSENESIEMKIGAILALIGYAVTAVTNFLGMSNKNQSSEI